MDMVIECSKCHKPQELCVCSFIETLSTRTKVLILQHPQEPDEILGSARLAHLCLPNSILKIGLSWRNLAAALGEQAVSSRWCVLYLGSGIKEKKVSIPLQFVSKKGTPIDPPGRD